LAGSLILAFSAFAWKTQRLSKRGGTRKRKKKKRGEKQLFLRHWRRNVSGCREAGGERKQRFGEKTEREMETVLKLTISPSSMRTGAAGRGRKRGFAKKKKGGRKTGSVLHPLRFKHHPEKREELCRKERKGEGRKEVKRTLRLPQCLTFNGGARGGGKKKHSRGERKKKKGISSTERVSIFETPTCFLILGSKKEKEKKAPEGETKRVEKVYFLRSRA